MTNGQIIIAVIVYLFLFELALSFSFLGLTKKKLPGILKLQHKAWLKFSHVFGEIMSKIILTILWIVGFGPYAIVWKIIHLKKKKKDTYWIEFSDENNSLKYPF